MHGELPKAAFEVRRPDNAKDTFRTTRYEGLKKMGGRCVSKECNDVVASVRRGRRIVICVAGLEPVHLRETMAYESRISNRPGHGP